MLTLLGNKTSRNCETASRREFLKIGTLGIGGLSLVDLLRGESSAAVSAAMRNKSKT